MAPQAATPARAELVAVSAVPWEDQAVLRYVRQVSFDCSDLLTCVHSLKASADLEWADLAQALVARKWELQ